MKVMVKARFTLVLGRSSQKKCKSMQSPLKWQICLLVCAHSKVNLVRVHSGITALTRSPFCVTALFNLTLKALQKDHNAVLHIWLLSLWKYFFCEQTPSLSASLIQAKPKPTHACEHNRADQRAVSANGSDLLSLWTPLSNNECFWEKALIWLL